MTGIELLQKRVSYKLSSNSMWLKEATLYDMLVTLPMRYKSECTKISNMEYHSDQQRTAKSNMPLYYVIGTFKDNHAKDDNVKESTNLMTIDIDLQDNPDMDVKDIRSKLFNLPYVLGVYTSISGKGIYALVYVEDYKSTASYYEYLAKLFKFKYNITVDKQAKNIARARIISYNEDWKQFTKTIDEITPWRLKPISPPVVVEKETKANNNLFTDDLAVERTQKAIWRVLKSGYNTSKMSYPRAAWFHLGCEFANFKDGYEMFHTLSTNSSVYNDDDKTIKAKYDECIKQTTGITEDLHRKWQGLAKRMFGSNWWKDVS